MLVVDDHDSLLEVLAEVLEDDGFGAQLRQGRPRTRPSRGRRARRSGTPPLSGRPLEYRKHAVDAERLAQQVDLEGAVIEA